MKGYTLAKFETKRETKDCNLIVIDWGEKSRSMSPGGYLK